MYQAVNADGERASADAGRWASAAEPLARRFDDRSPVAANGSAEAALHDSHHQIRELVGRLISAQEDERARIARDLHDDFCQRIASLSIEMSGFRRRLPAEHTEAFAQLHQKVLELANEVRGLSHELHPGVLRHAGLIAALRAHCAEFQSHHGIEVSISSDDDLESLTQAAALSLYRVAQEALRNTARHADANHAEIKLSRHNGHVRMVIRDDGRGFDLVQAKKSIGLGLVSLEERIRLLHGCVSIATRPGDGVQLCVEIPVGETCHAAASSLAGR